MPITELWLVHETLPNSADRIEAWFFGYDDIGQISRNLIDDFVDSWFGGDWPLPPLSGRGLKIQDFSFEETPRSISDGLSNDEYIAYPNTMTLTEALGFISPNRTAQP